MPIKVTKESIDLGLIVRNTDKMLHFYKDVLGLPHVGSLPLPGGGVMERLNIGTTVLKLTTRASIPEASNPSGGLEGATGIRYFTITVEDVDGAVELCKGDNAPIVIPAVDFRPGVRIAIVEDPDGNLVEFLQITPQ